MVGIMISIISDNGSEEEVETEESSCPLATRDEEVNEELKEKAVEEYNYRGPNTSVAFRNDKSCASCAFYDTSEEMQECMGDESGDIGYCVALTFVCRGENTCDMWKEEYKDNL